MGGNPTFLRCPLRWRSGALCYEYTESSRADGGASSECCLRGSRDALIMLDRIPNRKLRWSPDVAKCVLIYIGIKDVARPHITSTRRKARSR